MTTSATSMPASLSSFIDAAADAVARAIAGLQKEWQREREIRDAEYRARLAELDARVAAVANLERQVAARLATLRDGDPGKSITIEEVTPLLQSLVAKAVGELPSPKDGEDADPALVEELVASRVAAAVAALPPPTPGKDADPELVEELVASRVAVAVAALPPPAPGKDADPELVEELVASRVAAAVAALPPPTPGKDADPELVEELVASRVAAAVAALPPPAPGKDADPAVIEEMVSAAVGALPPPAPGKDADPELVRALVVEIVQAAVAQLPPPAKGDPGDPGKLPIVVDWSDRVFYAGDVVAHKGATYQAARDTAKEPPHVDWRCLAAAGADGRSLNIRGTWSKDEAYSRLDIVALNGASFCAKRDDPGACPGDGWQLIASQGKRGNPGERVKGDAGRPGSPVVSALVSDQGLLTLTNGDGSKVTCDLYPLLVQFQQGGGA